MSKKHLFMIVILLCSILLNGMGFGSNIAYADDGDGTEKNCMSNTRHPVATRLANRFKVEYSEIMAWHCKGHGFGEITKAYALAQKIMGKSNGLSVSGIFELRASGQGWGKILKMYGLKMKDLKEKGNRGKGKGNNKD